MLALKVYIKFTIMLRTSVQTNVTTFGKQNHANFTNIMSVLLKKFIFVHLKAHIDHISLNQRKRDTSGLNNPLGIMMSHHRAEPTSLEINPLITFKCNCMVPVRD